MQNENGARTWLTRTFNSDEIDAVKHELGMVRDLAHNAQSLLPRIIALRAGGKSLSEIGRELGLTRQAVRRALADQRRD